jgi:hypothetical protein
VIIGNIEIVTLLTILLFGIPLIICAIRTEVFKTFSIGQLTKTFNRALLIQIIIGLTFLISISFLEKKYYSNGKGNNLTDICMETGLTYLIIGTFFYMPGLVILNIANLILRKKTIGTNE